MAKQSQKPADQLSRIPVIKDWHAILGIGLAVVIFFRDILLQKAFFWEDFMYYYYPARNFAAVSMAGGELPLWNPFTFNGMPFQADIQTALFYIPNMLLTIFVSGGRLPFYWLEVEIIAHYIIAGVCMYYLAKSFGMQNIFAFFSGLLFALSGFMITRAIHQPMICETAWLPLIGLLFRKAILKKSVFSMILTASVIGHTILAGFPQLTLYIFFLLFLIFIFESVFACKAQGIKSLFPMSLLAGGAVALSIALAAIQLLPTIELAPYTQRAEMSYVKSLDGSLSWTGLLTLIIPKFFGAQGAQGSTLWAEGAYGQYWETCVYIGIAGFIALLFALPLARTNKQIAFLFGIAVFSLLYAVGDSFILHKLFFNYVPTFNKFREPGRLSYLWTFAAAILGGFGLQRFFETAQNDKKKSQRNLLLIAGAGIFLWVIVSQGAFQPNNNPNVYAQIHDIASSAAGTSAAFVIVICVILLLRGRNILSITATIGAIIIIQFIDMNVFGFDQNNGTTNLDEYYARPGEMLTHLKEESQHEIFRTNSRAGGAMILDRNQGMIDRIFTMEGYSSLVLQRIYPPGKDWEHVRDMMNGKYFIQVDERQRSMSLGQSTTYLPRAYMVYDARKITDDAQQKAFMSSDAFHPDRTVVLEEDLAFPSSNDTSFIKSTANISSYKLNDITVNVTAPKDGYLCFGEVYYPGWNAYIDGVPHHVYRSNWNLRAVPVEAGTHTIEMKFEPKSFSQGMMITFATMGVMLIGGVFFWRKERSEIVQTKEV